MLTTRFNLFVFLLYACFKRIFTWLNLHLTTLSFGYGNIITPLGTEAQILCVIFSCVASETSHYWIATT